MLTVGGFRGKAWWEEEEADMIQFSRFRKSKLRIKNFEFDALVKKKIAKRKAETKSTNGGDDGGNLKKLSDEQMQEQPDEEVVPKKDQTVELAAAEGKFIEEPKIVEHKADVLNTGSTFGTIWTNVPTTEAAKQGELKPELKDQSIQTEEEEEVPAPMIQIVQFEDLIRIVVKLNKMDEVLSQMGNVLENLCIALQAHSTEVSNLANYVT